MQAHITPQEFVRKWSNVDDLTERQTYQNHFRDVCNLFGFEHPMRALNGLEFIFERYIREESGQQGYADVYFENHFAVEYKAPGKYKSLDDAYQQLQRYREKLKNPPLLLVTDINNWEIHTNFPNTEKKIYRFSNDDILNPDNQRLLRLIFENPQQLHPDRTAEQVTKEAAQSFKEIVDNMRGEDVKAEADVIAHFLTKLVFCLFAEDVGLLPVMGESGRGLFSYIVRKTRDDSDSEYFKDDVRGLFDAMNEGKRYMAEHVPYFNGSLFDDIKVVGLGRNARNKLYDASLLNWEYVEPTIFGTLFERAIDEQKRAQLGAHYTGREDIMLIVDPVLMKPLKRQWAEIREKADKARERYDAAKTGKTKSRAIDELIALRDSMRKALSAVKVLDPACGSGNFLYVALQSLLDMEQEVITYEAWSRIAEIQPVQPQVHPKQMYGIEKNKIAHALASIVVWIGYIQWKIHNGYRAMDRPILQDIHNNILNMDAILAYDENGKPIEPEWQAVDVIIGNPPFLGGSKLFGELGEKYQHEIWKIYKNRVPGFADLVCYWFEKTRQQIEDGKVKRAGLLATNSIRGGANREVLNRIKKTGGIFMAYADREWVLDGAAVRVSMIGFDNGSEKDKNLDDSPVQVINPDLTASVDITIATKLNENNNLAFMGGVRNGPFDIDDNTAKLMLKAKNANGLSNSAVVRPWLNGSDIVKNPRNMWIIQFDVNDSIEKAKQYESPFEYVETHVFPIRQQKSVQKLRDYWWLHESSRPYMQEALKPLSKFIATPTLAKYRLFVWLKGNVVPDKQLIAVARDDDYFFGVLHSKLHEVWSLRMGTWLGKGNDPRYTPTTTFETFPFPYVPGAEDESSQAYQKIASAAKQLHQERDAWLNPGKTNTRKTDTLQGVPTPGNDENVGTGFFPSGTSKNKDDIPSGANKITDDMDVVPTERFIERGALKHRTLTNLYNALAVFRGEDAMKIKPEAGDFAPRLAVLHDALDQAVCDAYGWEHDILSDEEEILRRLLALNLARAEGQDE